jgi:membrane-bound lytic murein transglycosylase MltF
MVKVYTKGYLDINYPTWNRSEWKALLKLWDAESHWNPYAYNHSVERYSGLHAGGVAQMLGVKTTTPAPQQVARGLSYIKTRYGKPSVAWAHERRHGWY